MKKRFEGESGRRLLADTLREQQVVAGNEDLAHELATLGALIEVESNKVLIHQGEADNDIYFIIAGGFQIMVQGKIVNTRRAGTHVGEMAAIQPTQRRSATVVATEDSLVYKLAETQFSYIADKFPQMWRFFAKELARRLEQRNALITKGHDNISVFIMSSAEALDIARAVQNAFERDPFSVVVWTDGVFRASNYPIEALEHAAIRFRNRYCPTRRSYKKPRQWERNAARQCHF
jgi:CRP/FNR family transcriptional regulator, cyclic AMP receptor protein